jgi:hypothetical protein
MDEQVAGACFKENNRLQDAGTMPVIFGFDDRQSC